jgi:glyceraldehyde 3-phosphate dehydrogenase
VTVRVAVNGFGRIGRNFVRALHASDHDIELVAINDLVSADANAHLLRYDSTYGRFSGEVEVRGDQLVIDGHSIRVVAERSPAELPWAEIGVDVVIESTGRFTSRVAAAAHVEAGAARVIISAAADDADATFVAGVNDADYDPAKHVVVSNASCTTNCFVPMVKVLDDAFGLEHGLMTTVHAYTNDQRLTDVFHEDLRRARSATMSMIPTKTGAAAAVGLVLPELNGKLDGFSIRVPTINVSLVDLTFTPKRATTIAEINTLLKAAADGPMKGILAYTDAPLVSVDYNHDAHSSTYDATLTRLIEGQLVKVCAWYDNEWGFSNRMIDTTLAWSKAA